MGLAVHFRCHQPEAEGLRIDVMSHLRAVDPFAELWQRRTTLAMADETMLKEEEEREGAADRTYWAPLRKELERLRQVRRAAQGSGP
jgi:hypothetical protein